MQTKTDFITVLKKKGLKVTKHRNSLLEVLEIGFETGLEVLKGEKTIAEGMETVFEKTGGSQKSEDE